MVVSQPDIQIYKEVDRVDRRAPFFSKRGHLGYVGVLVCLVCPSVAWRGENGENGEKVA